MTGSYQRTMNERLAFYADELRDAVYDLDEFDDCDEIRDIKQAVHRVALDLRVMAFDPRYDVEHCGASDECYERDKDIIRAVFALKRAIGGER